MKEVSFFLFVLFLFVCLFVCFFPLIWRQSAFPRRPPFKRILIATHSLRLCACLTAAQTIIFELTIFSRKNYCKMSSTTTKICAPGRASIYC